VEIGQPLEPLPFPSVHIECFRQGPDRREPGRRRPATLEAADGSHAHAGPFRQPLLGESGPPAEPAQHRPERL